MTLFDLGGGAKIRDIWSRYYSEIHGIIFVVDASAKESIADVGPVLRDAIKHDFLCGKPVLVLANKQDCDGAVTGEELRHLLSIDALATMPQACVFRVQECAARLSNKQRRDPGLDAGMVWLLNAVEGLYSSLAKRMTTEMEKQQEIERVERNAKRARIKARREEEEAAAEALAARHLVEAHSILDEMAPPGAIHTPRALSVSPHLQPEIPSAMEVSSSRQSPAPSAGMEPSITHNTWVQDDPAHGHSHEMPEENQGSPRGNKKRFRKHNKVGPAGNDDDANLAKSAKCDPAHSVHDEQHQQKHQHRTQQPLRSDKLAVNTARMQHSHDLASRRSPPSSDGVSFEAGPVSSPELIRPLPKGHWVPIKNPLQAPDSEELADVLTCGQRLASEEEVAPLAHSQFDWIAAKESGAEGWAELQKQKEDGGRFAIDKVAARVHAGWGQAVQHVWDEESYGAAPTELPDPEDDECWAASSFTSADGHGVYQRRLMRAAAPFERLPAPAKEACRLSAELLLLRLCACEPELESVPVKRRDAAVATRAAELRTALMTESSV